MHVLLRPNTVSVLRQLSVPRRVAFHTSYSLLRKGHETSLNSLQPVSMPVQEGMNSAETFSSLDVLGSIPAPQSAVEATYADGFLLNSGMRVNDGVILLNNEVFVWRPVLKDSPEESKAKTGVLELAEEAWGLLDVVYPKPGWSTPHPLPRDH